MKGKRIFSIFLAINLGALNFAIFYRVVQRFKDHKKNEITLTQKENVKFTAYENGNVIQISALVNGFKNGICYEWYPDGRKKCELEYNSGKRCGRCIYWYQNGLRKSETHFLADLKNGLCIQWYPNARKKFAGKYVNDKKEGRWLHWDVRGNIVAEEFWKQGRMYLKIDPEKQTRISYFYYRTGQRKYQMQYQGLKKHGRWIKWFADGKIASLRCYLRGEKNGYWLEKNKTGDLIKEIFWNNGKILKKLEYPEKRKK